MNHFISQTTAGFYQILKLKKNLTEATNLTNNLKKNINLETDIFFCSLADVDEFVEAQCLPQVFSGCVQLARVFGLKFKKK